MPMINPEEAIKDGFKRISRRGRAGLPRPGDCIEPWNNEEQVVENLLQSNELQLGPPSSNEREPAPQQQNDQIETIMLRKGSTGSATLTFQSSESVDSRGGDSLLSEETSVEIIDEDFPDKLDGGANNANGNNISMKQGQDEDDLSGVTDMDTESLELSVDGDNENEKGNRRMGRRRRIMKKRCRTGNDRRKSSWIPCTCPQYKVSHELATRRDLQGIFFCKILAIKVIQLLIINITIFSTGLLRKQTLAFLRMCHDWTYLAYGIFVALLLCLRVAISYRARWPKLVAFIIMLPMTFIIAFTSSCITTVYNSVLIPLITCSIFLTFLVLCFAPYLLRKHVMDRSTNCTAAAVTLLACIFLIFLKELEPTPITYWDFLSQVWLPALFVAQIIVQISVIEVQRMLFGLCFNISSSRWHIAGLYL